MVTRKPDDNKNPWLPVHEGATPREAVAPSKPHVPAASPATPRPEPVEAAEAEVIAPDSAQSAEAPAVPVFPHDSSPAEGPVSHPNPFPDHPPSAIVHDDEPAYNPRPDASPTGPADPEAGEAPDEKARKSRWRSVPALVVAGLLVMGAIGYGVYLALPEPEQVELAAPVVVVAPSAAALEPASIDDPTDFQAALPTVVGAYALTAIDEPAPAALGLEVRAAEASLMTYSDGESDVTLTAVQHYDQEAAVAQFEALAVDGTDRASVEAAGAPVGERATIAGDDSTTVVWRNGTAVFQLTGPAAAVETLFAAYTL